MVSMAADDQSKRPPVRRDCKRRNLSQPPTCACLPSLLRGTLSSYAYVLLAISLLQRRSPPILPALQSMPPQQMRFSQRVGPWTCTFNDDVESLKGFGEGETWW